MHAAKTKLLLLTPFALINDKSPSNSPKKIQVKKIADGRDFAIRVEILAFLL
jgi:hypothetical protein